MITVFFSIKFDILILFPTFMQYSDRYNTKHKH